MNWISVPREFDFINNKNKFFNYVNMKWNEEYEVYLKKRKYDSFKNENQNLSRNQQHYHITNQQGSQLNYHPN